jgi:hypothetical protein
MSEIFHVNMSYIGSVVLKEEKISMTSPNFCIHDHLPFEEDLALYLNNLEFPLPKDDLYQV